MFKQENNLIKLSSNMKKLYPYLLILFGLLLLFCIGIAEIAGICLLLGIVMIIESIWPEQWDADSYKGLNG